MQDTIADLFVRISNAQAASLKKTYIPYSNVKEALLVVLKKAGYIADFKADKEARSLVVELATGKKFEKIRRVSKPGRRMYTNCKSIPRPKGGYGIVIMSTPIGVLSGEKARQAGVGGEIICEVY